MLLLCVALCSLLSLAACCNSKQDYDHYVCGLLLPQEKRASYFAIVSGMLPAGGSLVLLRLMLYVCSAL